tara:strand:+ start:1291 stop:1551 length:261 start_codon:yes stop_codon:yes gene_type:complete
MIKLLKYLATNLGKEDLYNLAMFLSDNPDVIDQETLLHIVKEVNDVENSGIILDKSQFEQIKNHFDEMDKHQELHNLLKDNDISLN